MLYIINVRTMTDDITEDTFRRNFTAYLRDEHRSLMVDFLMKRKGLAIAFFDSWETARNVAQTYKEKFMDHSLYLSLFSETDPSSST